MLVVSITKVLTTKINTLKNMVILDEIFEIYLFTYLFKQALAVGTRFQYVLDVTVPGLRGKWTEGSAGYVLMPCPASILHIRIN